MKQINWKSNSKATTKWNKSIGNQIAKPQPNGNQIAKSIGNQIGKSKPKEDKQYSGTRVKTSKAHINNNKGKRKESNDLQYKSSEGKK